MMIYMMRHGIASEPNDPSLEQDRQRPLTDVGREKIEQIARKLKKLAINPDLILSSPYVRAQQTASIVAKEFDLQKHIILSDLLQPAGTADTIVNAIVENYLADELLIVGHEPCLGLLISFLAAANLDLAINIKKGGVCCLSTDDLRMERRAALEWLLPPKLLLKG